MESEQKYLQAFDYAEQLIESLRRSSASRDKLQEEVRNRVHRANQQAGGLLAQGKHKSALRLLKRAERMLQSIHTCSTALYCSLECLTLNSLACVYKETKCAQLALDCLEKAIELGKTRGADCSLGVSYLNSSSILGLIGNRVQAKTYADAAVKQLETELIPIRFSGSSQLIEEKGALLGFAYFNQGLQTENLGDKKSALQFYLKAREATDRNPEASADLRQKIQAALSGCGYERRRPQYFGRSFVQRAAASVVGGSLNRPSSANHSQKGRILFRKFLPASYGRTEARPNSAKTDASEGTNNVQPVAWPKRTTAVPSKVSGSLKSKRQLVTRGLQNYRGGVSRLRHELASEPKDRLKFSSPGEVTKTREVPMQELDSDSETEVRELAVLGLLDWSESDNTTTICGSSSPRIPEKSRYPASRGVRKGRFAAAMVQRQKRLVMSLPPKKAAPRVPDSGRNPGKPVCSPMAQTETSSEECKAQADRRDEKPVPAACVEVVVANKDEDTVKDAEVLSGLFSDPVPTKNPAASAAVTAVPSSPQDNTRHPELALRTKAATSIQSAFRRLQAIEQFRCLRGNTRRKTILRTLYRNTGPAPMLVTMFALDEGKQLELVLSNMKKKNAIRKVAVKGVKQHMSALGGLWHAALKASKGNFDEDCALFAKSIQESALAMQQDKPVVRLRPSNVGRSLHIEDEVIPPASEQNEAAALPEGIEVVNADSVAALDESATAAPLFNPPAASLTFRAPEGKAPVSAPSQKAQSTILKCALRIQRWYRRAVQRNLRKLRSRKGTLRVYRCGIGMKIGPADEKSAKFSYTTVTFVRRLADGEILAKVVDFSTKKEYIPLFSVSKNAPTDAFRRFASYVTNYGLEAVDVRHARTGREVVCSL